jgi:16S rRNA C1402 (ribose-2'-O) methylase RsmI
MKIALRTSNVQTLRKMFEGLLPQKAQNERRVIFNFHAEKFWIKTAISSS